VAAAAAGAAAAGVWEGGSGPSTRVKRPMRLGAGGGSAADAAAGDDGDGAALGAAAVGAVDGAESDGAAAGALTDDGERSRGRSLDCIITPTPTPPAAGDAAAACPPLLPAAAPAGGTHALKCAATPSARSAQPPPPTPTPPSAAEGGDGPVEEGRVLAADVGAVGGGVAEMWLQMSLVSNRTRGLTPVLLPAAWSLAVQRFEMGCRCWKVVGERGLMDCVWGGG